MDEVERRIALMQHLSIPVEAYNQFVTQKIYYDYYKQVNQIIMYESNFFQTFTFNVNDILFSSNNNPY